MRSILAVCVVAAIQWPRPVGAQTFKYMAPSSPGQQNTASIDWGWNTPSHQHNSWNYQPQWSHQQQYHHQHWHQPQYYQPQYYEPQYHEPQYAYAPAVTYSNLPITISMPYDQGAPCSYSLHSGSSAWNYSIDPGGIQTFNEDRAWQIRFDRGPGYGFATYSLRPGAYRFRQSSRGWELYRAG